jgi:hypothetical protein
MSELPPAPKRRAPLLYGTKYDGGTRLDLLAQLPLGRPQLLPAAR